MLLLTTILRNQSKAILWWLPLLALLFASTARAQFASGWWYNPAEGGRGFFIEQQGGSVFLAAFLYDDSGRPTWLSSGGSLSGAAYSGPLDSYAGGQTMGGPYTPPAHAPSPGTLTLQFADSSHATLSWPGGTTSIQRFPIVPGGLAGVAASPQSGWYWNPAEGGRGFAIEIQNGNIMVAGFMYDAAGRPIWYVSQGPLVAGNPNLYQGQWVEYANGQTLSGAYKAPLVANPQAGALVLQFTNAENAILTLPNGQQTALTRFRFAPSVPAAEGIADIVRLLNQTTFGASERMISHVQNVGIVAYVEEQLAAAPTSYPPFPYFPPRRPAECYASSTDPNGPGAMCARDNYTLFQVQLKFFQNALGATDQLRQRVAWALSQIMVTSGLKQQQAYAMGGYQDLLLRNALGNFRTLLYEMTLSPMMGLYLDMVNNDKPNPANHIPPNENYARELLQLFSVGVHRLNPDGSVQTDQAGQAIAAYGQEEIEGFAHVFTGWTYAPSPPFVLPPGLLPGNGIRETSAGGTLDKPGTASSLHNPPYFGAPMVAVAANHDQSEKRLLNGIVVAAGMGAEYELNTAIDVVFHHPNVGPFIGRQLIQKLVTSNPSAAYVARVASAFDNNGAGVRGDMKAVIRAILLDPEARGDAKADPAYGHLREPVLFITGVLRALDGTSDGVYLRGQAAAMQQDVFFPPSVFNYFSADYAVPGSALSGPEFGIQNAATTFARYNFVNRLVYGSAVPADATVVGATGTSINLTGLQALATEPAQLVEWLNTVVFSGAMSSALKSAILSAVLAIPASDALARARAAAYLAVTSPQFQVIR